MFGCIRTRRTRYSKVNERRFYSAGIVGHNFMLFAKYRDVSKTETVVTFVKPDEVSTTDNQRFTQWGNNAVGLISKGNDRVVVRVASHS